MKTIINIGTNKGNLVGIVFNKPFEEITSQDIMEVVTKKFGENINVLIYGWADVNYKRK